MTATIYEYSNGFGVISYREALVRDYGGRGCWELKVEIPEELDPYISTADALCIEPKNSPALRANKFLFDNDGPCAQWWDDAGKRHWMKLTVLSREERSTAMYI